MQQGRSKKVIIIGPAYPLRGGLATFNHRLCKAFLDAGFNASLLSFSLQYPAFMFPGTSQYSSDPAPDGIEIKTIMNSINPFNWIKTGFYLKKQKPDVIIVRYWLPIMGPCLGTILRFLNKKVKVICIADNIIPHEKRFGDDWFTHYFAKPIHAFVTMSNKVTSDLVQFNKKNKPVLQLAHPLYDNFGALVPKERAKEKIGLHANDKVLLFFGFIRKYKGLDMLIEAMQSQNIKNENIKLIIAGEFYEDEGPYKELIDKTENTKNILLFNTFIPDSEVGNYLNAADVVVQPYRNATQSGVTPLAFYFEKPMIVTNVGGLPQMAPNGKSGIVCEPNINSIESAILQFFIEDTNKYLPYLQQQKKEMSWDNFVKAIIEIS
jgi:glycosyltransferase involved in cell wall biosynthesis